MAFSTDIGNLVAHLKLDGRDFDAGVMKAESRMRRMGERMQSIGRSMMLRVTAPIVASGAMILKTSMKLESAFIGVQKTVDATAEEYAILRKGFEDLAKVMPLQIEQLFGIGEAAGQLGIAKQNIIGFTEVMAQLGATTDMAAQTAAMQLARFANIMQTPQDEFDRLGSTIVDLGNNMAAMESEIVEMAMRIAGAGKMAGMTEAQLFGMAAALASVGVQAQLGGTAIQKMIISMSKAVSSGNRDLRIFATTAGTTADEFARLFRTEPIEAFNRIVEGLATAGENAFAILEDLGLADQRLLSAILRLANAQGILREGVELGSKAFKENTALVEEFNKRVASGESQLQIFWNQVRITTASFEDALRPAFEKVIGTLKSFFEWLEGLSAETKKFIVQMGLLVAAIGPTVFIIGKLLVLLTHLPIVFAAAAIGVLLLGKHLSKTNKTVETFVTEVAAAMELLWIDIKHIWAKGVFWLKIIFGRFKTWVINSSGDILENISKMLSALESASGKALGAEALSRQAAILKLYDSTLGLTKEIVKEHENYEQAVKAVGEALVAELTRIEKKYEDLGKTAKNTELLNAEKADEAKRFIQSLIDGLGEYEGQLDEATQKVKDMMDSLVLDIEIQSMSNQQRERRIRLIQFERAAIEAFGKGSEKAKEAVASFTELLDEYLAGERGLPALTRSLNQWAEDASNIFQNIGQVITSGLDKAADALTEFVIKGKADVKELGRAILTDLLNAIIRAQMAMMMQKVGLAAATPMAKGGIIGMQHGGIINSPTLIPTRTNDVLIGEAAPEAVMPLARDSQGRLGVRGQETQVNVKNINVFDQSELLAAMRTHAGEQIIMNVIQRNSVR